MIDEAAGKPAETSPAPEGGRPKLAVCHYENPTHPAPGAGMPSQISAELKRRGRLGAVIYAAEPFKPLAYRPPTLKNRLMRAGKAASKWLGFESLLRRRLREKRTRQMYDLIRSSGATDVLHFYADYYLPMPERPPGTRHYLVIDSVYRHPVRDGGGIPRGFRRYADEKMRQGYHQVDHVFSLSEHTRDSLVRDYGLDPSRVSVIGTGRGGTLRPFVGEKDYSEKAVLFVCKGPRFREKNGHVLVEALKLARQKDPDVKLWLAGGDDLSDEERAGTPGLTSFGFVTWEKLQELFDRASLFALPAPAEPWGLVFIEALSCKTPILGLNRNAVPELTGHGRWGFMVEQATPQALAAVIVDAVGDPGRLRRMGEEAQRYCLERFTWEKTVDRILERVDRTAGAGAGSGAAAGDTARGEGTPRA